MTPSFQKLSEQIVAEFEAMKLNLVADRPMLDYEHAMQKIRSQYRTIAEATAQAGVVGEREYLLPEDGDEGLMHHNDLARAHNAARQLSIAQSKEWLGGEISS